MDGFERYTQEMEDFRKSELFHKIYPEFLRLLKTRTEKSPVLEMYFGIKSSQVRELVKYARRAGEQICSGSFGYRYSRSEDDTRSTIHQLTERYRSIQFTAHCLEQSLGRPQSVSVPVPVQSDIDEINDFYTSAGKYAV